jgi:hypothetical protein
MLTVEHHITPPADFLSNEAEGYAFYKAFQDSAIENFELGYLVVKRGQKRVAVVPYFVTNYYVNTTLENGWLKRLLGWLWFRVACVGHPVADFGIIDGEISEEVLQAVNIELFKLAPIVGYNGFGEGLPLRGFSREPSLPVAALEIKGDFYSGLSGSTRRDFRRRLRKARAVRIEECDTYPKQLAKRIYELYLETFKHAEMTFERLTPQFFENMASVGKYVLYWENETLIGFSLLICKDKSMLAKYMGMDYSRSRKYGLYHAMILNHIEICVRDGYTLYQPGVSTYSFKKRIGSTLIPTYIYFRHGGPVMNWIFSLLMKTVSYG